MKSSAVTIPAYLRSLPPDRRKALEAVRRTILKNLPKGYEEAITWGAICYQVPLRVYPDTYNKQPLMYAALASQKQYMAVYLCNVYCLPGLMKKVKAGFKAEGKKLDMGKSCIRFKKLEDLSLKVVGRMIAATPMKESVAFTKRAHQKRK